MLGAHAMALSRRARGLVSLPEAATEYGSDRRTFLHLYESGAIRGELVGDKVYLHRDALDAWASPRPRCTVDVGGRPCGRLVLGEDPGCNRKDHQRVGQHHSPATRARISETHRSKPRAAPKPTPTCSEPECDKPAPGDSGLCAEHWPQRLQEGHREYREKIAELKARGLMTAGELGASLPGALKRDAKTISRHLRYARINPQRYVTLSPEQERDDSLPRWPSLFSAASRDEFVRWLERHPDGRMRRWDEQPDFRSSWYLALHKSTAEYGRHAPPPHSARFQGEDEEKVLALELLAQGESIRATAATVGLSKSQVGRLKQSSQS
jgi:hypothetical protein